MTSSAGKSASRSGIAVKRPHPGSYRLRLTSAGACGIFIEKRIDVVSRGLSGRLKLSATNCAKKALARYGSSIILVT